MPPPESATVPVAGTRSATPALPTSSRAIVFDWALTTVTTFCLPLLVVRLSNVSIGLPPWLT